MGGAETRAEVSRVLEKYREVVFSMVHDAGQQDLDVVELWWALAKAQEEIEVLVKYSDGLRARVA